jgi:hypothetical protein
MRHNIAENGENKSINKYKEKISNHKCFGISGNKNINNSDYVALQKNVFALISFLKKNSFQKSLSVSEGVNYLMSKKIKKENHSNMSAV